MSDIDLQAGKINLEGEWLAVEDLKGSGPADGLIVLNGTPVNDAPSFSTLGDQNVVEDSGPHSIAGFATALPRASMRPTI